MKGYPIGVFLFWNLEEDGNYTFYEFIRDYDENNNFNSSEGVNRGQEEIQSKFSDRFFHSKKIAKSSGVKAGETVLEIGAGKGILTSALLKIGANVVAFEIDEDLFDELEEKFKNDNVEFIFQDFLKYDKPLHFDRCVSNIPYNITTAIIEKWFTLDAISITIMVQKEYTQRLLAFTHTRAYGSLTVFVKTRYEVKKLFDVSKGSFFPVPRVDSTVLRLERMNAWIPKIKDMKTFEKIVRTAFSHKRKMIKNNLKSLISEEDIAHANISPSARAEELDVEDFVRLTDLISRN